MHQWRLSFVNEVSSHEEDKYFVLDRQVHATRSDMNDANLRRLHNGTSRIGRIQYLPGRSVETWRNSRSTGLVLCHREEASGPFDLSCREKMAPFHLCNVSTHWDNISREPYVQRFVGHMDSIIAHKLVFSYLLVKPVNFDDARPEVEMGRLADCVELARYYDMSHVVAPLLSRDIKRMTNFWTHVSGNPAFYMTQGAKLRDEELFVEAFRHFAASSHNANALPEINFWAKDNGSKRGIVLAKYREQLHQLVSDLHRLVRTQMLNICNTSSSADSQTNGRHEGPRVFSITSLSADPKTNGRHEGPAELDLYIAHALVSVWYNRSMSGTSDLVHSLQ